MPRIIVAADSGPESGRVFLDEKVDVIHLQDEHSADQITERLVWAVNDAQEAQAIFAQRVAVQDYRAVASS